MFYLFIVVDKKTLLENKMGLFHDEIVIEKKNLVIIYLTLERLVGIFNSKENIAELIFGNKYLKHKNFELIGRNSFF